jgi:type 1 glutamine amidotransferase
VVFNNTSGDVFSTAQQAAFKAFIENGGGYLGLHAAGDNSHAAWGWYIEDVIGALFTQHTMDPQFQEAAVTVEDKDHAATQGLPASWRRTEEWYSFDKSPRTSGARVLIAVDEKTYKPVGMFGKDLRMGDHPAVWSRCMGKGRVLYTIFGHRAEAFAEPETKTLLTNATGWALDKAAKDCATAPEGEARAGDRAP